MSNVEEYINNRMNYFTSLECDNCDNCEKRCNGYKEFLSYIACEVVDKFKTKCNYIHCGEFNSTGYDMKCYAIAFIDENGEIKLMSFKEERC